MAKKLKSFQVTARLVVIAAIDIAAESYEDAVVQSKTLDVTDFVKIKDEYHDGSISIGSISVPRYWDTDQE